jgi:predicted NAD/FAD-binding protein
MMERIAIIGSGISGLGCAHFLHRRYDLTIFEAASHIGGHSCTVTVREADRDLPIDTGFMVYNEVTYPQLTRLFALLDVATMPTEMSFSVHHGPSGVEWNGSGINGLFGQRRNLLNPRHWKFLLQLDRFNKESVAALAERRWDGHTLGQYVTDRGYGPDFLDRYLIPMSSAVWSAPPERMLQFPAIMLLRFWHNHGFLGMDTHHPWRTIRGGSREYVARLVSPFRECIRTSTPVLSVHRSAGGVDVTTKAHGVETFDKVIIAAHADQALRMLTDPTDQEADALKAFNYQSNSVDLHVDSRVMPGARRCWASWNYRSDAGPGLTPNTTTHYWMNRLQGVSERENYFVSLNSRSRIALEKRRLELEYEHPLFNLAALEGQQRLPALNRAGDLTRTYYCGAYFRYGFHEDGLLSALNLCEQILGGDPWDQ